MLEISPAGAAVAAQIGERLAADPGAALLIDYGYDDRPWRGSLQAVAGNKRVGVLSRPGQVDLSAQVDFAALASAATAGGAKCFGPVSQMQLLLTLGLDARKAALTKATTPERSAKIEEACRQLIDPDRMGERFLALALQSPGLDLPAGFPIVDERRAT